MKNYLYIAGLLLLFYGCMEASSKPEPIVEEDSLAYYPPTPKPLSKAIFRHYYRIVKPYFDSLLFRRGFNGGIIVAKNGQVILEQYQGYADLRSKEPITDSTSFHIASTSKTFTGIAILQQVQEGRLSLSDTLQRFFPGLPYPGITVKMLLCHRSGLPNYLYFIDAKKWKPGTFVSNEDVLQALYTDQPARQAMPNRRFQYCNTNYVLLAMILEKVTGISYPEYIQKALFMPLQMEHSFVFTTRDTRPVYPSFQHHGAVWDNDIFEGTYGDKNIYSTPRDLLKWDQALYTESLINPSLLDSAFTPYSHEKPGIHNYGLGFRMLNFPHGKNVIYHFGRWHGFNAAFARLPDEKATIIVLGNKYNRNIYHAASMSYDLFGAYRNGEEEEEEP